MPTARTAHSGCGKVVVVVVATTVVVVAGVVEPDATIVVGSLVVDVVDIGANVDVVDALSLEAD